MVAQRVTHIPNEIHNKRALAGYETIPGQAVIPAFLLTGNYESNIEFPDASQEEATGMLDRFDTPQKGQPVFSGTYGEDASFERLARLMRIGLRSGDPAVLALGATAAWARTQSPNPYAYDVDRWSVEHFLDGLGFKDKGVSYGQWNIAGDIDDAANCHKVSGDLFITGSDELPGSFEGAATGGTVTTLTSTAAGWEIDEHAGKFVNVGVNHAGQIRQVISNTIDTLTVSTDFDAAPTAGQAFRIEGKFTSGIARQRVEKIPMRGTKLFLDPVGLIGLTQVRHRFVSYNITVNHKLDTKIFADTPEGEIDRESPGAREITYQVTLELDRRDEWLQLKRNQELALRVESQGSEIEPGINKLMRLDLPRASWTGVTKAERRNNLTATFAGRAYIPASDPIFSVHTINGLASV